jgi:hypothetical protein
MSAQMSSSPAACVSGAGAGLPLTGAGSGARVEPDTALTTMSDASTGTLGSSGFLKVNSAGGSRPLYTSNRDVANAGVMGTGGTEEAASRMTACTAATGEPWACSCSG